VTQNVQHECSTDLQNMLMVNVKAEIQVLDGRPAGLVQWLEQRIRKELGFAVR
jgi:hypothetical protein